MDEYKTIFDNYRSRMDFLREKKEVVDKLYHLPLKDLKIAISTSHEDTGYLAASFNGNDMIKPYLKTKLAEMDVEMEILKKALDERSTGQI